MTRSPAGPEMLNRSKLLAAILGFWVAAALVAGFGHALELAVARTVFGRLVWFSRDFVWMAPVAYALVMLPGVVPLALVTVTFRRTWMLALSAAALASVAIFGLLLPYSQISRVASLTLALGVATWVFRSLASNPGAWIRRTRRFAMLGVAMAGGLAAFMPVWRSVGESRTIAALPAPSTGAPNVLVIILDTVRAVSLSLYGAEARTTPRLEEWARSGVVFDWAFSPAPWTLPSHASMFTGAWPDDQSGDWTTPLDRSHRTLAEVFAERGYLTAGFVANMHYTAWDSGLNRGFQRYEGYLTGWSQLVRSSSYTQTAMFRKLRQAQGLSDVLRALRNPDLSIDIKHHFALKRGDEVTQDFLMWQGARTERPFFAFLNYFDAHQPYYAPPAFHRFSATRPGMAAYRGAIAYLDHQIDTVLTTLRERGVLDNTIVVVTSDHGELFGEKGLFGHAHNLYLNVLHVPLFVRYPEAIPRGRRVSMPVTLRDLAATIDDLAGVGGEMPGLSLAGAWNDAGPTSPVLATVTRADNVAPRYPTGRGGVQSLLDDRWQLIRNDDGTEELFDYRTDSLQVDDLRESPDQADRLAAMRTRLQAALAEGAKRPSAQVTRREP